MELVKHIHGEEGKLAEVSSAFMLCGADYYWEWSNFTMLEESRMLQIQMVWVQSEPNRFGLRNCDKVQ